MNQYSLEVGVNDLATTHPTLSKEWDYEKNDGYTPTDFSKGSTKKVWWKCEKGHSWSAVIYSRANGKGCPYCASNKVLPGFNDLATVCPEVVKEWDYKKNGTIRPEMVFPYSGKKAWWICEKKHSWQAVIASRAGGKGCPYCNNRQLLVGYNDLKTVRSDLAAELHPAKNGDIRADEILAGVHRNLWWVCDKGHEWKANVVNRMNGTGCPYCAGTAILTGFNDLVTRCPSLMEEWDYEENRDISPETLACSSRLSVWWKCSLGHKWKAVVQNRALSGTGCPYCSGRKPVEGVNDFATAHPELLEEWDWAKNTGLDPKRLTHQSRKVVWWICQEGHSFRSEIYERVHGTGCPFCSRKTDKHRVLSGVNDLATKHPELVEEWDTVRNGEFKPSDILPHSNRTVWWKCKNGHHWKTSPNARLRSTGCPYCKGKIPKKMRLI